MVVSKMKCGICGCQFEAEMLDREDPKERLFHWSPVRCPNCNSTIVEKLRVIRRVTRRVS